ncbi:hypothetical protein, partial [Pelagicoccus mobilis]|uniref:hypothetical protein n=1 Tax=Pelagicoccus mobilis TaxID=415221 RepID=UPI001F1738FA
QKTQHFGAMGQTRHPDGELKLTPMCIAADWASQPYLLDKRNLPSPQKKAARKSDRLSLKNSVSQNALRLERRLFQIVEIPAT